MSSFIFDNAGVFFLFNSYESLLRFAIGAFDNSGDLMIINLFNFCFYNETATIEIIKIWTVNFKI